MPYTINELFYSLQGEGYHAGTPAVFCRFSGCNLSCPFCDTDHKATKTFPTSRELAKALRDLWPRTMTLKPYVILTGGEPLLQADRDLIANLFDMGFKIAVETNGTKPIPWGVHWVTISPKPETNVNEIRGNELKLLYPVEGMDPQDWVWSKCTHKFLQPVWDGERGENLAKAVEYVKANPEWRLSLQAHKYIGIK